MAVQMWKHLTHVSRHQTQTWRLVPLARELQLSLQPMCLDSDAKQPQYAKHLEWENLWKPHYVTLPNITLQFPVTPGNFTGIVKLQETKRDSTSTYLHCQNPMTICRCQNKLHAFCIWILQRIYISCKKCQLCTIDHTFHMINSAFQAKLFTKGCTRFLYLFFTKKQDPPTKPK